MSEVDNKIEPDLFTDIQGKSEIKSAATEDPQIAFLHKCLHPPSAVPSYSGLPTNDTRTQVLVQWRNLTLMATPIILDGITNLTRTLIASDLDTFNYAILSMNGAFVLSVPFVYNSTVGYMTQDFNNTDLQTLYNFVNWENDANLYRPNYKSLTTYLNATAFNDTGAVAGTQFNPNILFGGTILTLSQFDYSLFKDYVSYHVKHNSIKLYHNSHRDFVKHSNQFNLFPKYVREDIISSGGFIEPNSIDVDSTMCTYDLDPNTTIQIVSFNGVNTSTDFVPDLSQTLALSERSYGGRARDGTFGVQRLNSISPQWLAASNTGGGYGLYSCYVFFVAQDHSRHLVPLFSNMPVGVAPAGMNAYILKDTLWSKDVTWSWTLYEGLSLNSQTSVSTQLLIKKYYTGYEVQPAPASAWSGMVRLAPKPNLQALQLCMDRFYELKDCMPAKFNFLGGLVTALAPSLISALPGIGKGIMNFFTGGSKEKEEVKVIQKPTRKPAKMKIAKREVNDIDKKINNIESKLNQMMRPKSFSSRLKPLAIQQKKRPLVSLPRSRVGRPSTRGRGVINRRSQKIMLNEYNPYINS